MDKPKQGRLQGRWGGRGGRTPSGRGSGRETQKVEYQSKKEPKPQTKQVLAKDDNLTEKYIVLDGHTSPFSHLVVHSKKSPYDVYIGRPGKWGNPFKIGPHGTREDVIRQYHEWITTSDEGQVILSDAKKELKGKVLGCFCSPEACHGHVLAQLVNEEQTKERGPNYKNLQEGMVLIKNAFNLEEQQQLVDEIMKYGKGEIENVGSFFSSNSSITKETGYVDPVPENSDPKSNQLNLGTKARMNIPFEHSSKLAWKLCESILDKARKIDPTIPDMNPTVWRINFYSNKGQIGWHFDRHPKLPNDMQHTVKSPVISVTLGNAGTFDYRNNTQSKSDDLKEGDFKSVKLESGDVIIFGGPSRLVWHRMVKVWPNTKPEGLNIPEHSGRALDTGRINFAFYDN